MHFLQIKQENIVNIVNWKICKTNLDKLIYLPRISMIHLLRIVFQIFFSIPIFFQILYCATFSPEIGYRDSSESQSKTSLVFRPPLLRRWASITSRSSRTTRSRSSGTSTSASIIAITIGASFSGELEMSTIRTCSIRRGFELEQIMSDSAIYITRKTLFFKQFVFQ